MARNLNAGTTSTSSSGFGSTVGAAVVPPSTHIPGWNSYPPSSSETSSSHLGTPTVSPRPPTSRPLPIERNAHPFLKPVYSDFIEHMHARHQSWASAGVGAGLSGDPRSLSSDSDGSDDASSSRGVGSFSGGDRAASGLAGPSMPAASTSSGAGMQARAGNFRPVSMSPNTNTAGRAGPSGSAGAVKQEAGSAASVPPPPQAKARRKKDADGKRRKVAKACLVCQKSHLTCDEQRPCTRCVKKGIADQCIEGVRKKAKYLLEGEGEPLDRPMPQLSISPTSIPPAPTQLPGSSTMSSIPAAGAVQNPLLAQPPPSAPPRSASVPDSDYSMQPLPPVSAPLQQLPNLPQMNMKEDIWLAPQMLGGGSRGDSPSAGDRLWGDTNLFGNGSFDFGTSASNEYQMLDAMLNSMSPVFSFDLSMDPLQQAQQPQQSQNTQQPHNPYLADPHGLAGISPFNTLSNVSPSSSHTLAPPLAPIPPPLVSPHWPTSAPSNSANASLAQQQQHHQQQQQPGQGSIPWSEWTDTKDQHVRGSITGPPIGPGPGQEVAEAATSGNQDNAFKQEQESTVWGGNGMVSKLGRARTGAEVYHGVVKPFDYTEGYHRLMEYISRNFEQKEVLRVVKALAAFRPSLIALQMPMSEDDEVFLERSFQRTLIELEKLISYSATPTAVWRRTGDVVYANPEFCSLIGTQQDELLNGRPYIYQLFAKHTAISYWENFSVHAFENTTQNFFQAATLEVGEKQTACSCCFTIRRDVFDLPSVIIGQFLPIPGDS